MEGEGSVRGACGESPTGGGLGFACVERDNVGSGLLFRLRMDKVHGCKLRTVMAWNNYCRLKAVKFLAVHLYLVVLLNRLVGNIVRTTFSNGDDRKAFVVLTFRLAVKVLLHIASK